MLIIISLIIIASVVQLIVTLISYHGSLYVLHFSQICIATSTTLSLEIV